MGKLKKIVKNKRIIILVLCLILALYFINPTFSEGVAIRSVQDDSSASQATPEPVQSPDGNVKPRDREVIHSLNNQEVESLEEYQGVINSLPSNETVTLETDRDTYYLDTSLMTDEENLGIRVMEKPTNNIRQGIDLAGGTRVMLEPEEQVSSDDMNRILDNIEQRLDVFGLGDVSVRSATDLFGDSFVVVEIAGVEEEEVVELLSQQGVFEAKIANETVFGGGDEDIIHVYRSSDRAGIEPGGCQQLGEGRYVCNYRFSITLSQEAAERQADATRDLEVVGGPDGHLSENITLHLDGEMVDQLRIAAGLRGTPSTEIQISGSGEGNTEEAAREAALADMRRLQTVIETGSLPVSLDIVKTDTISPAVGSGFVRNAAMAGLLAILTVITVVSIRYRQPKISIPMSITMLSEVVLLFGVAALINWNIDMAAIAAIIIAVGSGVDHQIVIAEETLERGKKKDYHLSWKKRMAKAFFVIMAAYFTLLVAMIPLWFAGAGLLRGFALTTIIGVSIGVLITRPAFGQIMEIIFSEEDEEE